MGCPPSHSNKHIYHRRNMAQAKIRKDYVFTDKPIGVGAFSQVYPAVKASNPNFNVAIKAIAKRGLNRKQVGAIHREIEILADLDHPNVVKYYESYEDRTNLFIVMELLQGVTLARKLREQRFTEYGAAVVLKHLLEAVKHCHEHNVAHRDIKTDNLMIDEAGKVTLIDFGLSKMSSKKDNLKSCAGTPMFMAPEILKEKYSVKCDLWS